jgi:predicted regulator of Ras-like GTPase activity (Roadblock/LC7/MglB family)
MTERNPDNLHILRTGIGIADDQNQALIELLTTVWQKIPAKLALLVDTAGQLLSVKGETEHIDLVMLSSLIAGDIAASQEISRLVGEYDDYQIVLREGNQSHILICEAGEHLALLVQVDQNVPLGWARMWVLETAKRMTSIIETAVAIESPILLDEEEDISAEEFSDLFGDALDDLWLE